MAISRGVTIRPAVADDDDVGPPRADDPRRIGGRESAADGGRRGQRPEGAADVTPSEDPGVGEGQAGAAGGTDLPQPPAPPRAGGASNRSVGRKGPAKGASRKRPANGPGPTPAAGTSQAPGHEPDMKAPESVAAAIYGERVQRSVMIPAQLWLAYRALASDMSTPRRRVSGNDLVLAVVLVHAPETIAEADQLVGEWEDLLLADEGPGYGPAVQRPMRLYESQVEHLNQLDRELSLRRIQGARSKIICAVLHFHRPPDHDAARRLLAAVRVAERAAPARAAA